MIVKNILGYLTPGYAMRPTGMSGNTATTWDTGSVAYSFFSYPGSTTSYSTNYPYNYRTYALIPTKQTNTAYSPRYGGLMLGTGTTPATINDYCLEEVITDLTFTIGTNSWIDYTIVVSETWYNASENAVTINEIGHFIAPSNSSYAVVMMARQVLESPITINAGDSRVITFTYDFENIIGGSV